MLRRRRRRRGVRMAASAGAALSRAEGVGHWPRAKHCAVETPRCSRVASDCKGGSGSGEILAKKIADFEESKLKQTTKVKMNEAEARKKDAEGRRRRIEEKEVT